MACHHHHNHHENNHPTRCCCCCSSNPSRLSQPSQPPTTDPLLQAIATHLLQSSQTHLSSQFLKPYQHQHQHQHQHQKQQKQQQQQSHSLLSSLLHRIDALESSLHHLSVTPPPYSLRDTAARTIQTHFRAFLVRRSRTLRHLKHLAFIKSNLNCLKSSISDETHLNPQALSQKAMDLLLKLDSIQGGDPMIRDGKRSISRELVRFLEFVDGIYMKRQEISTKAMKTMRSAETHDRFLRSEIVQCGRGTSCRDLGGDQRAFMENLSGQVQEIRGFSRVSESDEEAHVELEGFHHLSDSEENPKILTNGMNVLALGKNGVSMKRHEILSKPKKNVSFAEKRNVSRVFISPHEPFPSEEDQRELVEKICREVEEIGGFSRVSEDEEEGHMEDEGSPQISDGEKIPGKNVQAEVNYGISRHYQGQNGNFVAPLPVQMEPRRTDMVKKKIVRVPR